MKSLSKVNNESISLRVYCKLTWPVTTVVPIDKDISELSEALSRTSVQTPQSYKMIDSTEAVADLVTSLSGLPVNPPSLYIDLEGENLSR